MERIFSGLKVLVVMPDGGLSYYTDTVCGENYWTYLSEELPEVIRSYFPVSEKGKIHLRLDFPWEDTEP